MIIKLLYTIGVSIAIGIHSWFTLDARSDHEHQYLLTFPTNDCEKARSSLTYLGKIPSRTLHFRGCFSWERGRDGPNERDLSPAWYVTTIFVDFDSHRLFFRFRKAVERAALSSCWITWRVLRKNDHKLQSLCGEYARVSFNSILSFSCDKYYI